MNIADAIKKARERGLSDEQILLAIEKQNPHKADVFQKAKKDGASATEILNKTISQEKNSSSVEQSESFDIPQNIPQKPTDESKLWIRIFITLGLVSIAAFSFTLLYRTFFVPRLEPIEPETIVKEIYIPRATYPLIKMFPERDAIERFAITVDEEYLMNLRRIVRESREGEIIRIIAEDQRDEFAREVRVINLEDFFEIFNINYPDKFFEKIGKDFNLFVYTGEGTGRVGFVIPFPENNHEEVEWNIMRPWEKTIEEDFRSFFSFWNQEIPITEEDLSSTSYQGDMPRSVSIRYREGSGGAGLYYTIARDRLIFSTSLESIQELIERHYELVK